MFSFLLFLTPLFLRLRISVNFSEFQCPLSAGTLFAARHSVLDIQILRTLPLHRRLGFESLKSSVFVSSNIIIVSSGYVGVTQRKQDSFL